MSDWHDIEYPSVQAARQALLDTDEVCPVCGSKAADAKILNATALAGGPRFIFGFVYCPNEAEHYPLGKIPRQHGYWGSRRI